jgi:hypothetical protein
MLGSAAIDLAWVAAGRLDASIMLANKVWDVAAGVTIAREAGAQVLDLDGTIHTPDSLGTVSTTAALAAELTELLRGPSKPRRPAPPACGGGRAARLGGWTGSQGRKDEWRTQPVDG